MAFKPNFTELRLKGDKLTAAGVSNDQDADDILGIQIFVRQEDKSGGEGSAKMAIGFVPQAGPSWEAEFDAKGITVGPALAVGVETHTDPITTISWVEPMEIEAEE